MANVIQQRADLVAKIRALFAKTVNSGCTEAEAMEAARKAGELMAKWNIELSETEINEEGCISAIVVEPANRYHQVFQCTGAIGKYCNVKVYGWRDNTGYQYKFYGYENDVEIARNLLIMAKDAINNEFALFMKQRAAMGDRTSASTYRESFKVTMSRRIGARLQELGDIQKAELAKISGQSTALVVLKGQEVTKRFEQTDDAKGLRTMRKVVRNPNEVAKAAGYQAGNRFKINEALGN